MVFGHGQAKSLKRWQQLRARELVWPSHLTDEPHPGTQGRALLGEPFEWAQPGASQSALLVSLWPLPGSGAVDLPKLLLPRAPPHPCGLAPHQANTSTPTSVAGSPKPVPGYALASVGWTWSILSLNRPISGSHCRASAPRWLGQPFACPGEQADWWHLYGQTTRVFADPSSFPLLGRPELSSHQLPCLELEPMAPGPFT